LEFSLLFIFQLCEKYYTLSIRKNKAGELSFGNVVTFKYFLDIEKGERL